MRSSVRGDRFTPRKIGGPSLSASSIGRGQVSPRRLNKSGTIHAYTLYAE
jgi:hypothetical protein